MDRHFAIPATIAAAVHAALLFGIPGSPAKSVTTIKDKVTLVDAFKIFNEPPPPDPEKTDSAAPRGSPDAYRPTLDETPRAANPNDFVIKTPDTPPTRMNLPVSKIPEGTFGDPQGLLEGIGLSKDGPLNLTDLDGTPRTRVQGSPVYPYEAKQRGMTGNVLVEFMVEESGSVSDPRAVKSSDPVFNEAAVRAVARWKFEPGKRGGRVVRFRMAVPIVFSLNDL